MASPLHLAALRACGLLVLTSILGCPGSPSTQPTSPLPADPEPTVQPEALAAARTREEIAAGRLLEAAYSLAEVEGGARDEIERELREASHQGPPNDPRARLWVRGDPPPTVRGLKHIGQNEQGLHEYDLELAPGSVSMRFVLLPRGALRPYQAEGAWDRIHQLDAFLIAKTECTWEQYQALKRVGRTALRRDPPDDVLLPYTGGFGNTDYFWACRVLGQIGPPEKSPSEPNTASHETDRMLLELPTKLQWEYACLGGLAGKFGFTGGSGPLSEHAWFEDNSGEELHEVGLKKPNGYGLHDMHGNAAEPAYLNEYNRGRSQYAQGGCIADGPLDVSLAARFAKDHKFAGLRFVRLLPGDGEPVEAQEPATPLQSAALEVALDFPCHNEDWDLRENRSSGLRFSPTGRWLAASELYMGDQAALFRCSEGAVEHVATLDGGLFRFSADEELFACSALTGLTVFSLAKNQVLSQHKLDPKTEWSNRDIEISATGSKLLRARRGTVELFSTGPGMVSLVRTFHDPDNRSRGVDWLSRFSPDGRLLLVRADAHRLEIVDDEGQGFAHTHHAPVTRARFTADSRTLIVESSEAKVRSLTGIRLPDGEPFSIPGKVHRWQLSAQGQLLILQTIDARISVVDLEKPEEEAWSLSEVGAWAVSPRGLLATTTPTELTIRDLEYPESPRASTRLPNLRELGVGGLEFVAGGRLLLVTREAVDTSMHYRSDPRTLVYQTDLSHLATYQRAGSLAFSSNGLAALDWTEDGQVWLLDPARSMRQIAQSQIPGGCVDVRLSPDGSLLAVLRRGAVQVLRLAQEE